MNEDIQVNNYINAVKQYRQDYYQNNKEKIINQVLNAYNANRDHKLEAMKKYRDENKERLHNYSKQKVPCICGCLISITNRATHQKSAKHLKLLKDKIEIEQ